MVIINLAFWPRHWELNPQFIFAQEPLEGNCDVETDPLPLQNNDTIKYTAHSCMQKCGITPMCSYFKLDIIGKNCIMFPRAIISCTAFLGSSESVLKGCGKQYPFSQCLKFSKVQRGFVYDTGPVFEWERVLLVKLLAYLCKVKAQAVLHLILYILVQGFQVYWIIIN